MDFPPEEYRDRLEQVQAEMAKHDLPVLILHGAENICYLSGFYTVGFFAYHALIVPAEGEPILVLRALEEPNAIRQSWLVNRWCWQDGDEPIQTTQQVIKSLELEGGKIGIEQHSWYLTLKRYRSLRELLPHATFVDEPLIVDHLRLIKSPREVEYIRAAACVAEAQMQAGIDALQPGVSEREVLEKTMAAGIRAGGEPRYRGSMVAGQPPRYAHHDWGDGYIELGDVVKYELTGRVKKYIARLMRTSVVGTPARELIRTFGLLTTVYQNGLSQMRPGVAAADIDKTIRGPLIEAGLREPNRNRIGYSIGLVIPPTAGEFICEFTPDADWTLQSGMVFHMLIGAKGGIGFSETVLVTDDGAEELTRFERKLFTR
jgi:Xaa-Pro dipeptidase